MQSTATESKLSTCKAGAHVPSDEDDDCGDHRGQEHEAAEHSQSYNGTCVEMEQVITGLQRTLARNLNVSQICRIILLHGICDLALRFCFT